LNRIIVYYQTIRKSI